MYPDEPEDFGQTPPSRPELPPKPSMAPSWVLLGFGIGVLFIWMLPPSEPPAAAGLEPAAAPVARSAPQIAVIEAVFAEWGSAASWENDVTEVALWSSETGSYSQCFQVIRTGGMYFFRSIPRLTRPVLTQRGWYFSGSHSALCRQAAYFGRVLGTPKHWCRIGGPDCTSARVDAWQNQSHSNHTAGRV